MKFFQRLHWKLTLSYTAFTSAAVVLTLLGSTYVFAILYNRQFSPENLPQTAVLNLFATTRMIALDLPASPEDVQTLLDSFTRFGKVEMRYPLEGGLHVSHQIGYDLIAIVDDEGEVLASSSDTEVSVGSKLEPGVGASILHRALAGEEDAAELSALEPSGASQLAVAAVPLQNPKGAVFVALRPDSFNRGNFLTLLWDAMRMLPMTIIRFVPFILLLGVFFGLFVARIFTGRFDRLATAADAWSQGNFSVKVRDEGNDELSQLGSRLNRMAQEVQSLLETRQELATLEERNRLARDLHDSVKQQVFATAMQAATARQLLDRNPAQAKQHLQEAETLARQSQKELTDLIRELRPAALEGEGLVKALKSYLETWSQRTGIETELRITSERPTTLGIELDLYRVVQEALANVAKHSGASTVDISLTWDEKDIILQVQDNGAGFDAGKVVGKGVGLSSMRERIEGLGGQFALSSERGSTLTATVPYKAYQDGKEVRP